jgi:uncharacterized membrane protein
MVKVLVAASLLWPALLAASVWQQADGRTPVWSTLVYLAGSRICHQRPERTFETAGIEWPVCGRCSGLYVAAPLGALLAAVAVARRRFPPRPVVWLAVAAVPTALSLGLEWFGLAHVTNIGRFLAALPLGAAVAFAVVQAAAGPPGRIGYTGRR